MECGSPPSRPQTSPARNLSSLARRLAIVSGCIYLPFEIYQVIRHPNELHWVILGINILVVLYIAWVRWDEIKDARSQQEALPSQGD